MIIANCMITVNRSLRFRAINSGENLEYAKGALQLQTDKKASKKSSLFVDATNTFHCTNRKT